MIQAPRCNTLLVIDLIAFLLISVVERKLKT